MTYHTQNLVGSHRTTLFVTRLGSHWTTLLSLFLIKMTRGGGVIVDECNKDE